MAIGVGLRIGRIVSTAVVASNEPGTPDPVVIARDTVLHIDHDGNSQLGGSTRTIDEARTVRVPVPCRRPRGNCSKRRPRLPRRGRHGNRGSLPAQRMPPAPDLRGHGPGHRPRLHRHLPVALGSDEGLGAPRRARLRRIEARRPRLRRPGCRDLVRLGNLRNPRSAHRRLPRGRRRIHGHTGSLRRAGRKGLPCRGQRCALPGRATREGPRGVRMDARQPRRRRRHGRRTHRTRPFAHSGHREQPRDQIDGAELVGPGPEQTAALGAAILATGFTPAREKKARIGLPPSYDRTDVLTGASPACAKPSPTRRKTHLWPLPPPPIRLRQESRPEAPRGPKWWAKIKRR